MARCAPTTQNRLLHWQQNGAVYFVTFRLADAVPKNLRDKWESDRSIWLRLHPEPWTAQIEREYHQRFTDAIERWLDAGHRSCVLRRADCAEIAVRAKSINSPKVPAAYGKCFSR